MAELLLELYSEEIPPNLQINARNDLESNLKNNLKEYSINTNHCQTFSCPTRLLVYMKNLPLKVKMNSKEIKGPKSGLDKSVLESFLKSHNASINDIYEKNLVNGKFFFLKKPEKIVFVNEILKDNLPKIIQSIRWKKSMRWSDTKMYWGRPLRSIFALFNKELIDFKFNHLVSTNQIIIEDELKSKTKKIFSFNEYDKFIKTHNIFINQLDRKEKIKKELKKISNKKKLEVKENEKLLNEVTNIVDFPNTIVVEFDKRYLDIPKEIITSTLIRHQKYFPLFNSKNEITNYFIVVSNKKDKDNIIKLGNKRVVEARLSDAKFFWEKDKSKNLIKQIAKLKKIKFFDQLGSLHDKTQRMRKLGGWLSDEININKEKVEIAASISKSDLCSDLVAEYPELQGVMGRYFALAQGFDKDVSNAISDHYLPSSKTSIISTKPISYSISIVDKVDTLVGFFLIDEKPTSSKDPLALRRAAIGLLKTIIQNKLNLKFSQLLNYNIKLYEEQGTKLKNNNTERELMEFLRERMRNIFKEKNVKTDVIEASISSHNSDNFFELYKKCSFMNKFINKEIGQNAINSYKRASNIIEKDGKGLEGRPDAVLFRKNEEKYLFDKINEIRKSLSLRDENKDFEKILKNLSEMKMHTDNFFNNVKVNDDNEDLRNNRLELLKMFCNTFNNFINFSKLEGIAQ